MYKTHPEFPTPERVTPIWHYFTLPKFLSFLQSQSLFLCRHDKFGDGYEGKLSAKDVAFFEEKSLMIGKERDRYGCSYSSCWTKSDVDEYVLWGAYSSLRDGIAIKSTVGRLIDSLNQDNPLDFYLSDVIYIDYQKDYTFRKSGGIANLIAPHFVKRKYFEAEKEIRLMHFDPTARFDSSPESMSAIVNQDVLIESVFVSPFSPDWFSSAIEDLLQHYGLGGKMIMKSEI